MLAIPPPRFQIRHVRVVRELAVAVPQIDLSSRILELIADYAPIHHCNACTTVGCKISSIAMPLDFRVTNLVSHRSDHAHCECCQIHCETCRALACKECVTYCAELDCMKRDLCWKCIKICQSCGESYCKIHLKSLCKTCGLEVCYWCTRICLACRGRWCVNCDPTVLCKNCNARVCTATCASRSQVHECGSAFPSVVCHECEADCGMCHSKQNCLRCIQQCSVCDKLRCKNCNRFQCDTCLQTFSICISCIDKKTTCDACIYAQHLAKRQKLA